jgi:hypothetical protein
MMASFGCVSLFVAIRAAGLEATKPPVYSLPIPPNADLDLTIRSTQVGVWSYKDSFHAAALHLVQEEKVVVNAKLCLPCWRSSEKRIFSNGRRTGIAVGRREMDHSRVWRPRIAHWHTVVLRGGAGEVIGTIP